MTKTTDSDQEGSLGETVGTHRMPKRLKGHDFNYWAEVTRHVERLQHNKSFQDTIDRGRAIYRVFEKWIEGYEQNERYRGEGFSAFLEDWRIARMFIPLQARLLVEQICYTKGWPWRRVCSGFNSI